MKVYCFFALFLGFAVVFLAFGVVSISSSSLSSSAPRTRFSVLDPAGTGAIIALTTSLELERYKVCYEINLNSHNEGRTHNVITP